MKDKILKREDIITTIDYAGQDSYCYVIRDRKTNKIIFSEWSQAKAEEKLNKLLNK